jgi:hypothetical protein
VRRLTVAQHLPRVELEQQSRGEQGDGATTHQEPNVSDAVTSALVAIQ